MALIKFLVPQMRRLFEGGTYLKIGCGKEILLEANAENRLLAQVTGKRKFTAFTAELLITRILDRERNGRAVKYNDFELKNIAFDE